MNERAIIQYVILGGDYQFFLELFIPFLCVTMNCKRRTFFLLRLLAIVLVAFPLYFLPSLDFAGIRFNYIICFGLLIGAAFFLFDERPSILFLSSAGAFGLQHLVWNILSLVFIGAPHFDFFTGVSISITYLSLEVFFLACMAFLFHKTRIRISDNRSKPVAYLIGGILLFITFLLSQWIQEWNVYIRIYTIISCLFGIVCLFVFPALMDASERLGRLENEKQTLETMITAQAKQNEVASEIRELTNIHIHDLRHALDAIDTYDDEERKAYIAKVRADLDVYQGFAKTGNDAVDIILTEKSLLCHSKSIRFTYIVDGESLQNLGKSDMVSLLGNMLDNAIEAAQKEKDPYRVIKLNIKPASGMLVIECINYAHELKDFSMKNYSSSKPLDQGIHGYGIKSMKLIVKRYGGSLDLHLSDSLFTARAIIPLSAKTE